MGRLVDIDEVIKVAENTFPQEDVRKIMWVLCHTPTAYDVEKVVDDLESEKIVYQGLRTETTDTIDIDEAIEIVRKGGV